MRAGVPKGQGTNERGDHTQTSKASLLTPFWLCGSNRLEKPHVLKVLGNFGCFGWRSPGAQLSVSFCFRPSCPIGRLGGGVGATAHCTAGPASSLPFLLFGRDLQPSLVCSWIFF